MDRRTLLGAVGAGLAGVAGCTGSSSEPDPTATEAPGRTTDGPDPASTTTRTEAAEQPPGDDPDDADRDVAGEETPVRLLSVDPQERAVIGEAVGYTFTVENPTRDPQPIEPMIRVRADGSAWSTRDRLDPVELAAGERRQFEPPGYSSDYLRTVELRVDPFGVSFGTVFTELPREFGQDYTDPLGRRLTVESLDIVGAYEYSVDDTRYVLDAGDDRQWVLVTLAVVNETDDALDAPPLSTFTLTDGDADYRAIPMRGETGYEGGELPWGASTDGRVAFKTPERLTERDLHVEWHAALEGGEVGVRWTPRGA